MSLIDWLLFGQIFPEESAMDRSTFIKCFAFGAAGSAVAARAADQPVSGGTMTAGQPARLGSNLFFGESRTGGVRRLGKEKNSMFYIKKLL